MPLDDDLKPEREDAPEQARKTSAAPFIRVAGIILALAAVMLCGYLLFSLFKETLKPPLAEITTPQTTTEQAPTEVGASKPVAGFQLSNDTAQQTTEIKQAPLPELNNSDDAARAAAMTLNSAEQWATWVSTDQALRKFVVVIDNLAAGKIATKYLPIPKPNGKFNSTKHGVNFFLNPDGFTRYIPYVQLFKEIDTNLAAKLYRRYSPLLEEAFAELGHSDRNFHDTLLQAFDVILEAPVIHKEIELVQPSVYYKYLDPTLEKSTPVDKQMLRMGPKNTQDLQLKIQELKTALSKANQRN